MQCGRLQGLAIAVHCNLDRLLDNMSSLMDNSDLLHGFFLRAVGSIKLEAIDDLDFYSAVVM
jgi:hypothetical protein